MEIRDPVHGSIHILDEEIPIIRSNFFQRLRNIKQLGFSDYVFPGATHTRFLHSIGVMYIGEKAFNKLFKNHLWNKDILRIKETFKMACLLHDIGHAPLSHSTESVMPNISMLNIDKRFHNPQQTNRLANHEDYTIKIITESSLSESFSLIEKKYSVNKECIADLIVGKTPDESYFTFEGINYFPILHQLVSSELDCDRMDYLLRDSYFCGVSYGQFDLDWMIDHLNHAIIDNTSHLGISERAVVTFDDFLLSRFHMFLQVYFHYRSVCLEQLLLKYFKTEHNEYVIPHDIDHYIKHDDHFLMKILRKSKNKYASLIVENKIPEKIYESFNDQQLKKLNQLQQYLDESNIDYIRSSSLGRLSKYYDDPDFEKNNYSLKVIRGLHNNNNSFFIDINEATDLFQKFSKSHAVNRLHCDFSNLSSAKQNDIMALINLSDI